MLQLILILVLSGERSEKIFFYRLRVSFLQHCCIFVVKITLFQFSSFQLYLYFVVLLYVCGQCDRILYRSVIMAGELKSDKRSFEFDAQERGWLKQSLMNQSKMLMRSRTKEITGGEIWHLRGKEIDIVNNLAGKF